MSCSIEYKYDRCSSRNYRLTCVTCSHYSNDENLLNKLLSNYREILDMSNQDHKGNLKFVESFVSRLKKKRIDNWLGEATWFVCEAIDLHKKTLGKK